MVCHSEKALAREPNSLQEVASSKACFKPTLLILEGMNDLPQGREILTIRGKSKSRKALLELGNGTLFLSLKKSLFQGGKPRPAGMGRLLQIRLAMLR